MTLGVIVRSYWPVIAGLGTLLVFLVYGWRRLALGNRKLRLEVQRLEHEQSGIHKPTDEEVTRYGAGEWLGGGFAQLLLVACVLGLLAAIAIPQFASTQQRRARLQRLAADSVRAARYECAFRLIGEGVSPDTAKVRCGVSSTDQPATLPEP